MGLLPFFDIKKIDVKYPIILVSEEDQLDFESREFHLIETTGNRINIQSELTEFEVEEISKFRASVAGNEEFRAQHSSMLFDINLHLIDERRVIQFVDEPPAQE